MNTAPKYHADNEQFLATTATDPAGRNLRGELHNFARALLKAMQSEKPVSQATDDAWDLLDYNTNSERTVFMLDCIAHRLKEHPGKLADELACYALQLIEHLNAEPLDAGGTPPPSFNIATCADDNALRFPQGKIVRACRKLDSEIEHIGLATVSLIEVRNILRPIANMRRVSDLAALKTILPKLLGGNMRAMKYWHLLTKLTNDENHDTTAGQVPAKIQE